MILFLLQIYFNIFKKVFPLKNTIKRTFSALSRTSFSHCGKISPKLKSAISGLDEPACLRIKDAALTASDAAAVTECPLPICHSGFFALQDRVDPIALAIIPDQGQRRQDPLTVTYRDHAHIMSVCLHPIPPYITL